MASFHAVRRHAFALRKGGRITIFHVEALAPAASANLGGGFDVVGAPLNAVYGEAAIDVLDVAGWICIATGCGLKGSESALRACEGSLRLSRALKGLEEVLKGWT